LIQIFDGNKHDKHKKRSSNAVDLLTPSIPCQATYKIYTFQKSKQWRIAMQKRLLSTYDEIVIALTLGEKAISSLSPI